MLSVPPIGGPNTKLPRPIESFLSWTLCIACLSVSGYHYYTSNYIKPFLLQFMNVKRYVLIGHIVSNNKKNKESVGANSNSGGYNNNNGNYNHNFLQTWIPLTTHSQSELERKSPLQRYDELIQMLYYILSTTKLSSPIATNINDNNSARNEEDFVIQHLDDELLIFLLRENTICRRLASLTMRPYQINVSTTATSTTSKCTTMLLYDQPDLILIQRMAKIWSRLLELPSLPPITSQSISPDKSVTSNFHISLIVPSYNESPSFIKSQLQLLLEKCSLPHLVEVIIVNAKSKSDSNPCGIGDDDGALKDFLCNNKSDNSNINHKMKQWGDIQLISFTNGGGRGPCLNYGANAASGLIVTFCHLDTKLPTDWDLKICNTLDIPTKQENKVWTKKDEQRVSLYKNHNIQNCTNVVIANSCAFSFGIDTSQQGLSNPFSAHNAGYYPPGIKAVETTANIRTKLFSLPYGDQCLSMPKHIFDFLGGYPDQCLMEDYELVALLRKRAALIRHPAPLERLKIIPGEPSLCSPRRWQKFGVLYVTFMNSRLVNMYAGGMNVNDLFQRYYGQSATERRSILSPWEVEMNAMINTMSKSQ